MLKKRGHCHYTIKPVLADGLTMILVLHAHVLYNCYFFFFFKRTIVHINVCVLLCKPVTVQSFSMEIKCSCCSLLIYWQIDSVHRVCCVTLRYFTKLGHDGKQILRFLNAEGIFNIPMPDKTFLTKILCNNFRLINIRFL